MTNLTKIIGRLAKKLRLKSPLLKVYFFSNTQCKRYQFLLKKRIASFLIQRRIKNGFFAIDIRNDNGIGSKLTWCITILKYCEDNNLKPKFRFSYPDNLNDYFANFFILDSLVETEKYNYTVINVLEELICLDKIGEKLTLEDGSRLLLKYFKIKPSIESEVIEYCDKKFSEKNILGIHYRGTDKIGEAPSVSYEKVINNILFTMQYYFKPEILFLSTDDQIFADFLIAKINTIPIIMRADYMRSSDNRAVHLNNNLDKNEINRDAVVNFLILSRTSFLIKTSSFLSDISKLINPSLPTVILNKPYESTLWFPAKEILKVMVFQPVD